MHTPTLTRTQDGFEVQFGVNHLGAYALTGALLPALAVSAGDPSVDTRVVAVSSMLHRAGQAAKGLDFANLNAEVSYSPEDAYAVSKLANLHFTAGFNAWAQARQVAIKGVTAHPGFASTNLTQHMTCGACMRCCFAAPPAEGALSILRAATDPDVATGEFYGPQGSCGGGERVGPPTLTTPSPAARRELESTRLWDVSASMTGVNYDACLAGDSTTVAGAAESKQGVQPEGVGAALVQPVGTSAEGSGEAKSEDASDEETVV